MQEARKTSTLLTDESSDVGDDDADGNCLFPKAGVKFSYILNEFLLDFGGASKFEGLTTAEVCENYIKPKTIKTKSSYCDILKAQDHPAFGISAKVFVSHAHRYKFLNLICALQWKLRDDLDTVVWLDLFSINQHQPMDWTFDWLKTTFQSAIHTMETTVMVMSPWDNPVPFTRAWCVFEAYCAVSSPPLSTTTGRGSRFQIALSRADENAFLQDMKEDPESRIGQMMATIKANNCQCSVPSDKESIFAVIESTVGFEKLDAMVFECYREWVLQVSINAFHTCIDNEEEASALQQLVGALYHVQGRYSDAQIWYEECVEKSKNILGEDNPQVSARTGLLARVLTKQGKCDEACHLLESCVKRSKKYLGSNHLVSFDVMYQLADVYYNQERYDEARSLYESISKGRKILLGANDPKTLQATNRLSAVLSKERRYEEAMELAEGCLKSRKIVLGKDHPHTLHSMSRLATILYNLGKYDEAESLERSCFDRRKAVLGKDHPHTLLSMSRLAVMLYKQGRIDEAKEINRICLERQILVLGNDHPSTLNTMNHLTTLRL